METYAAPTLREYQLAAELRAGFRRYFAEMERVARQHGLTPQRHALLLMIKGASDGTERSTASALAERLQLAQSSVTELVARAEAVGLLERHPARHDRRATWVRLTPEGERRLAATNAALGPENRRLLALVTELMAAGLGG